MQSCYIAALSELCCTLEWNGMCMALQTFQQLRQCLFTWSMKQEVSVFVARRGLEIEYSNLASSVCLYLSCKAGSRVDLLSLQYHEVWRRRKNAPSRKSQRRAGHPPSSVAKRSPPDARASRQTTRQQVAVRLYNQANEDRAARLDPVSGPSKCCRWYTELV